MVVAFGCKKSSPSDPEPAPAETQIPVDTETITEISTETFTSTEIPVDTDTITQIYTETGTNTGTYISTETFTITEIPTDTLTETPTETATKIIVMNSGGVRMWSDGTYVLSAKQYINPPDTAYEYSGDTGSGVYRLTVQGGGYGDFYCDMTTEGGGS